MKQLSKNILSTLKPGVGTTVPGSDLMALPEKVLQFGTGVLLRGLPDYFIDKANKQGLFNGRVVMVKSTDQGSTDSYSKQDNLYTLCVRGIEDGKKVDDMIINASISRVLSATDNWEEVLACAANPDLQIIISNTTEVGISLVEDDIEARPPVSFPGKVLSFLSRRYKEFNGSKESGMVIIPTELIIGNGTKLREIVIELARKNKLGPAFESWLKENNEFCNSLVDRIVPGKLSDNDRYSTEKKLGYKDDLMIMSEPFRLWAIESSSERVRNILSFAKADPGVVIAGDIEKFRELKLRLLNGTHSFTCALAYLCGFTTVREAMSNEYLSSFVTNLALKEIAPAISTEAISTSEANSFARSVIDRFKNPFIDHQWISIAAQYSSKMKMRNVPLLLKHYAGSNEAPPLISLGFAAYILMMNCRKNEKNEFAGYSNGRTYILTDDQAELMTEKWKEPNLDKLVKDILSEKQLWDEDLTRLPNFTMAVSNELKSLVKNGAMTTLRRIISQEKVLA